MTLHRRFPGAFVAWWRLTARVRRAGWESAGASVSMPFLEVIPASTYALAGGGCSSWHPPCSHHARRNRFRDSESSLLLSCFSREGSCTAGKPRLLGSDDSALSYTPMHCRPAFAWLQGSVQCWSNARHLLHTTSFVTSSTGHRRAGWQAIPVVLPMAPSGFRGKGAPEPPLLPPQLASLGRMAQP